jgi:hypothetical protein
MLYYGITTTCHVKKKKPGAGKGAKKVIWRKRDYGSLDLAKGFRPNHQTL